MAAWWLGLDSSGRAYRYCDRSVHGKESGWKLEPEA